MQYKKYNYLAGSKHRFKLYLIALALVVSIIGGVLYKASNSQAEVAPSGVTNQPASCPEGFIPVPGNSAYGTDGGFCIAEDVSTETAAIATARTNAATVCDGCHVITNNEWMTVAINAFSVPDNWSGGAVGDGVMILGDLKLTTGEIVKGLNTATQLTDTNITSICNISLITSTMPAYNTVVEYSATVSSSVTLRAIEASDPTANPTYALPIMKAKSYGTSKNLGGISCTRVNAASTCSSHTVVNVGYVLRGIAMMAIYNTGSGAFCSSPVSTQGVFAASVSHELSSHHKYRVAR